MLIGLELDRCSNGPWGPPAPSLSFLSPSVMSSHIILSIIRFHHCRRKTASWDWKMSDPLHHLGFRYLLTWKHRSVIIDRLDSWGFVLSRHFWRNSQKAYVVYFRVGFTFLEDYVSQNVFANCVNMSKNYVVLQIKWQLDELGRNTKATEVPVVRLTVYWRRKRGIFSPSPLIKQCDCP